MQRLHKHLQAPPQAPASTYAAASYAAGIAHRPANVMLSAAHAEPDSLRALTALTDALAQRAESAGRRQHYAFRASRARAARATVPASPIVPAAGGLLIRKAGGAPPGA